MPVIHHWRGYRFISFQPMAENRLVFTLRKMTSRPKSGFTTSLLPIILGLTHRKRQILYVNVAASAQL